MTAPLQPATPAGSFFQITDRDILKELLADKRSANTRRAYEGDLKDFFQFTCQHDPTPQLLTEFFRVERFTAIALVLQYKAHLINKGLAEATVNRRLAALKSLVNYAQKVGHCLWSLDEIEGEKIQTYRDTSGVTPAEYQQILGTCDRTSLKGKRDYAILRLLWDNALRRNEVSQCNCADFDAKSATLRILGKGRGTQAEIITLSAATVDAINEWLEHRWDGEEPLFVAVDRNHHGHRLSGNGLYNVVSEAAKKARITKQFSPHRCRHSSITAALDVTGGNVREVQKLSRHKNIGTLVIYDDQRGDIQGKMTGLLADLL